MAARSRREECWKFYVRAVVAGAAHLERMLIRLSGRSRVRGWRVAARKGPAKATIAAASKLARMVYWVLKEQREFVPKMSDRRATRLATSQSRKAASNDLGVTAPLL